jgi:hypothetical protein
VVELEEHKADKAGKSDKADKGNDNYKPEDEAAYRKLGPVREKEDWTRYPYADPVFRDGRGPFQTVEERPISNKTDKYSYWWKVPNNMGYPSGELDARLSFPYDQSTGGKSYNAFWGGGDRIDSIAQQHKELDRWWNDDGSRPRSGEDKDYADFWCPPSSILPMPSQSRLPLPLPLPLPPSVPLAIISRVSVAADAADKQPETRDRQ